MASSFGDASNEIGITLATARAALGITQNELHKRTGVSREAIKGYESGRNKPGAREIKLLCDALQITPNVLLYGSEQPFESRGVIYELMRDTGQFDLIKVVGLFNLLAPKEKESIVHLMYSLAQTRFSHDELKNRFQAVEAMSAMAATMISIGQRAEEGKIAKEEVVGETTKQLEKFLAERSKDIKKE